MLIQRIRKLIPLDSPIRIFYHFIRWVIANIINWSPSKDMIIVWITWTKWKTTTTHIVAQWLRNAWHKVFMFSTVKYYIWSKEYDNNFKMSSPSPFILQKLLKKAKEAWCTHAVIETTSHSLFYKRNYWINYDTAVLTNIAQDHLDLHKTMRNYVDTKKILFTKLIWFRRKQWVKKSIIVNTDSPYSEEFLDCIADNKYSYWINKRCYAQAIDIQNKNSKQAFTVKIPTWEIKLKTKLQWKFNIYNILAAVCVLIANWVSKKDIIKSIKWVKWVAWRMESIDNNFDYNVLIDYAHTPESLQNVIQTVRDSNKSWKLIIVFWACWDRDRTNRPAMGKIISDLSDIFIATEDDNYTESSEQILWDLTRDIKKKIWDNFWIIPDRKNAIRTALYKAKKWDTVMILWKWAETVQVTNNWKIPWNDKLITEEILNEIYENEIIA